MPHGNLGRSSKAFYHLIFRISAQNPIFGATIRDPCIFLLNSFDSISISMGEAIAFAYSSYEF